MNKVELIICDVDGTLVNDKRECTILTRKVIEQIHNFGIKFGIASGRAVNELIHLSTNWNISFSFDVIIGMNGSELYDRENNYRYDFYKLKKEWIKEILDIMRPFNLNPYMIKGNCMLCAREDDEIIKSSKRNGTKIIVAENENEFYEEETAKIMFKIPEIKINAIMNYAKKHRKSEYAILKTQPIMLEFADKRTNKANALKEYIKIKNLDLNNVIAFGDMTNDNELLQIVGMGICLKNGADDTKACADKITEYTNNEDGFARFMIDHKFVVFE